jgi:phage terminase large subunit-like protein
MTASTISNPSNEIIDSVYRYSRDVLEGRILAGQKVKMACERFERNLKASGREDCRWEFDEQRATRPIEFMERFFVPSKGDYDCMELMPWQRFVEANLYGWVDKETGRRRFREGLIVVGRGNGKSTMVSGNAIYGVSKDDERGADVYLLANSKEQASIVYNECGAQIRTSRVAHRFRVRREAIYYDRGGGRIQHRASDSRKLDGLNPSMAVFDEIHAYRDTKLIDVIKRGSNKRQQPLILYITTMGTVLDGPLMHYYQLFTDAMTPGVLRDDVADSMFTFICELDSPEEVDDPDTWIKANPSLGVLLDIERLKLDWERCKLVPQERSDFITKQLNIFCDASEARFVDIEVIERNNGEISEGELLGRECFGGFDLALTEDFTSAALEFPLDDGRIAWLGHSWAPRKKAELDYEKIPYYEWMMKGYLTLVDSEYVPFELVYKWFAEAAKKYQLLSIGYDPANAMRLVQMMQADGLPCNVVRQGTLTLNGPMKDIRERLLDGAVVMNRNPVSRWYLHNVKIRQGIADRDKENWMPCKASRYAKIDGFAALLCAHTEYLRMRPEGSGNGEPRVTVYSLTGG